MSRLLTMFRNSFVMRRAGYRSREINYERSQKDWQKGKQTGLRNCAQPGNCPVQSAHETWPARTHLVRSGGVPLPYAGKVYPEVFMLVQMYIDWVDCRLEHQSAGTQTRTWECLFTFE